ncbi:DUF2158 domain-containing protein [Cronobacter dublinensis]|uniref:YodC family protein n=1 Tax=Cronobacter sakazakii TaxID=28141 RepID=UPI0015591EFF|nr:DUF2158 domain-containing protein [Cronobacter sakazakii]
MEDKFEDGTLVQLKSGGPIMTVESYNKDSDKYVCEWFTNGKRNSELFRRTSLNKYNPTAGFI